MLSSNSDLPQNQTFAQVHATAAAQPIPGWRLNYAAGFVPLIAGISVLATTWINVARADMPWWTGGDNVALSYSSLQAARAGATAYIAIEDYLEYIARQMRRFYNEQVYEV